MIELRTPCRLHFGLLAYGSGEQQQRQYGGVGLMIRQPDLALRLEPNHGSAGGGPTATGPMGERAACFARRFLERAEQQGLAFNQRDLAIRILRAPRPHTGLGTGTQLGMAVARAIAVLHDREDLGAPELSALVGRGERSAIGAHGFFHGGLIVEGGKFDLTTLSPMLVRHPFSEDWRIVLVMPQQLEGLAGERERQAFASLPSIDDAATAAMCQLVLLGLLPALAEADLAQFGQTLYELQQRVGACFAHAQGGIYAHPMLDEMVSFIRSQGVRGVGQSSWGPTLYAITADADRGERLAADLQRQFQLDPGEVMVTQADNGGASLRWTSSTQPTSRH